MAEQICPTCGCLIANEGYETGGVVFCCEPCAKGEPCGCGAPASESGLDEEERHWHLRRS